AFFFVALFFLPETPKFLLISRSNRTAAERSVRFYHGSDCDVDLVIKEIILEAEDETETATSWKSAKELFTEPHLRRAILLSISALQNTVALWSMLLSSTYFLEEIGLDQAVASWSSTAMTLGYVLGTLAGSTWIERFGRRTILLSFTIVDNLLLVLYVICAQLSPIVKPLKYSCLVLLIAYAFIYGSGVGPISWFISSELVPQKYRSLAQSTCYSLNTIIVVILTFSILPLYSVVGSYAFLILYTTPSVISIVILYCYLPETKGREIHEIVAELRGKTKSS
ncbi:Membrane transporter, partial [Trichostrongylus colubriformis]